MAALTGADLEEVLAGAVRGLSPLRPAADGGEPWMNLQYVQMVKRETRRILDLQDRLRADGVQSVALYPAGLHTRRLLKIYWPRSTEVACLLDDAPGAKGVGEIAVARPGNGGLPRFQAVVLSSKKLEGELAGRCVRMGLGPVYGLYGQGRPGPA